MERTCCSSSLTWRSDAKPPNADGSLAGGVIMVATVLLQSQASSPCLHGLIHVEPSMVESWPGVLSVADRSLRRGFVRGAGDTVQKRGGPGDEGSAERRAPYGCVRSIRVSG